MAQVIEHVVLEGNFMRCLHCGALAGAGRALGGGRAHRQLPQALRPSAGVAE